MAPPGPNPTTGFVRHRTAPSATLRVQSLTADSMPVPAPTRTGPIQALRRRQNSASLTAHLPLTTVFSPPPSCLDAQFGVELARTDKGVPTAFRDYNAANSACWPSSYSELELFNTIGWYSPGVCPSGFEPASETPSPGDREVTLAWCCPSGMGVSSDDEHHYCSSYVHTSTQVRIPNSNGDSVVGAYSNFVALQWPISVQWASSDLGDFTPSGAPTLVELSSSISSNTNTPPSEHTTQTSSDVVPGPQGHSGSHAAGHDTHKELSTGAQAGIGVGVAIVGLALIAFGIWWLLRRRRQIAPAPNEKAAQREIHDASYKVPKSGSWDERSGSGLYQQMSSPSELDGHRDGVYEVEAHSTTNGYH